MRPRSWDENIGTGVASIDIEHRLQVSLVNALEELLRRGEDHALAERTLGQLVDFSSVHFHAEELMMRLYAYAHLEAHAQAHAKLLEEAARIRRSLEAGDGAEAADLVPALRGWLVNHIRSMDQDFAVWLAKNDVRPR